MGLVPFDQIYPDVARAEARVCRLPVAGAGEPAGDFLLREFYCVEPGCDCRRVLVMFMPHGKPDRVAAATINFGWELPRYYREWSSDPELWREMAGATLERWAKQGPHAKRFLLVFMKLVQDKTLVALFQKHYQLVKEKIEPPHDFTESASAG
jgi:hypothetical protein